MAPFAKQVQLSTHGEKMRRTLACTQRHSPRHLEARAPEVRTRPAAGSAGNAKPAKQRFSRSGKEDPRHGYHANTQCSQLEMDQQHAWNVPVTVLDLAKLNPFCLVSCWTFFKFQMFSDHSTCQVNGWLGSSNSCEGSALDMHMATLQHYIWLRDRTRRPLLLQARSN